MHHNNDNVLNCLMMNQETLFGNKIVRRLSGISQYAIGETILCLIAVLTAVDQMTRLVADRLLVYLISRDFYLWSS